MQHRVTSTQSIAVAIQETCRLALKLGPLSRERLQAIGVGAYTLDEPKDAADLRARCCARRKHEWLILRQRMMS